MSSKFSRLGSSGTCAARRRDHSDFDIVIRCGKCMTCMPRRYLIDDVGRPFEVDNGRADPGSSLGWKSLKGQRLCPEAGKPSNTQNPSDFGRASL